MKQRNTFASTLLFCIQQAKASNLSNQEASTAIWRTAPRVPALAYSAPVRVRFSFLPPPGQQQEDLPEDRKMEWESPCVYSKWVSKGKKCAYLLGEWGNRMCVHLRYLGSHSHVGCLYFQLAERSNKAWRIYVSFYPPVELVLLMVKWSGFQHCNLPLIFLHFYWAKGVVSLSPDLK